ncbi:MAG: ABC transporter substrate-binding protein [Patescibacteria group bacterium]
MVDVPAFGGELREGQIGLPRSINPVLAVSDVDRDLTTLVYSGLTRYYNGSFIPDLAKSWTISSDGLTYDFILKDNLIFQDSKPLTTDDIAFTIQKIQDPVLKSPSQADWANVSIKQISPEEIQFTLKQPYSGFLSNTTIGILPKHIWNNVSDDQFIFSQFNIEPIGSGMYKVDSIVRDSSGIPTSYNLASWNKYYDTKPFISKITFNFYPNQDKALSALNSGYIDSLPSIDPAVATKLISNTAESYTVLSSPLPRIFGVFFNQNQASILADANVRTALDLATDRNAIIENVLSGYGVPAYGPVPTQILNNLGINSTDNDATDTADVASAQALLEKKGWKKNADGIYELKSTKSKTPATLLSFDIYTANSPDLVATAKILKEQWSAMGANVNIQVFEPSDLYQNVIRTRKYDALLFGEQIGKDQDLYAFWHSSQRNAPGLNISLYTNSKVDSLLSEIRSTNSTSTIASDYSKFDKAIRSDIPAIFLYSPNFIYAIPKTLQGIHLDSIVTPSDHWDSITNWYVATEKVWKIFSNIKN